MDILHPDTIRSRSRNIFDSVESGDSTCFRIDRDCLDRASSEVIKLIHRHYPDLKVPYHSRWRHFEINGQDLSAPVLEHTENRLAADIELAIISVLLDAGAGKDWVYEDEQTQSTFSRSEGLAIASLYGFANGLFSSTHNDKFRVDGASLAALSVQSLATCFQVRDNNPLIGLESRALLLNRLGKHILQSQGSDARLSDLFPTLIHATQSIKASDVLRAVLLATGSIWPHSKTLGNAIVADVWKHRHAGGEGDSADHVPFHKLSQWLSYSLLEPLERQQIQVTDLEELTGLPEYRNGGLFIDTGVLVPLDEHYSKKRYAVDSEFVIEWRAMTVILLDMLAMSVREKLNLTQKELPLAAILQGGTWSAGRHLAQGLRDGLPPVDVISDGTVF